MSKIFIATVENSKAIIKEASFAEVSQTSSIVQIPNGDEIYFYADFIDNLSKLHFFWNNPELFYSSLNAPDSDSK